MLGSLDLLLSLIYQWDILKIILGFNSLILGLLYLFRKQAVVEPNIIKTYSPIGKVLKTYQYDRLVVVENRLYAYQGFQSTKIPILKIATDRNDWQALLQWAYRF